MTVHVLYLLAGIAIGVAATLTTQHALIAWQSNRARQRIQDTNRIIVPGPWPERGWHPVDGRPERGPAA